MELDKQNQKFNFFKTNYNKNNLGFSNLREMNDYTALLFLGLWIIGGMFFRMDLRAQQAPTPIVHSVDIKSASIVPMNDKSVQDKLKFISQVKELKGTDSIKNNSHILLKELTNNINFTVKDFNENNGFIEVNGLINNRQKVELSFNGEKTIIKWIGLNTDEMEKFTNAWKGESEIQIRKNNSIQETVLTVNLLKAKSPTVIDSSDKIKNLELELTKLKEENLKLKKNNTNLIVENAIKDNPHLKPQEKQIQKFVDSFVEIAKEK